MPSSVIASILYDDVKEDLYIRFVSGDVYRYKHVPVDVYESLRTASSKGAFLNKSIKGNYDYQKIEDDEMIYKK